MALDAAIVSPGNTFVYAVATVPLELMSVRVPVTPLILAPLVVHAADEILPLMAIGAEANVVVLPKVLLVSVSVLARPTRVSGAAGNVIVLPPA